MVSTVKLFDLFYKAGLLEHNTNVTTTKLINTMLTVDSLRSRNTANYMECIHTNFDGDPIAHVSAMPCFADNVWLMQQHCSIVTGHGVSIMLDVMKAVTTNPAVDYVIGFYNPKNEKAARIWKLAYAIMDNTEICDIAPYMLTDYVLRPIGETVTNLYLSAFKSPQHKVTKFLRLFCRPTGGIPAKGKQYDAVLFKVCPESKEKFKQLFS